MASQCLQSKSKKASSVSPLSKCAACQLAHAKQKGSGVLESRIHDSKDQMLKMDNIYPKQSIFIDQYESSVCGQLPHTKGKESAGHQYCIGTIFADHASRFVRCLHQVSLQGTDTILSKPIFEQNAKEYGVKIQLYHGDNQK
jgi:hypothetical protein